VNGRTEEAIASLKRFRTSEDDVYEEIEWIVNSANLHKGVDVNVDNKGKGRWNQSAVIAMFVLMLQVGTGIDIITLYGPSVFGSSNSDDDNSNGVSEGE